MISIDGVLMAFFPCSDLIKKFKVRINVLGALHLLPKHVQKAAAEAMQDTLEHDQYARIVS